MTLLSELTLLRLAGRRDLAGTVAAELTLQVAGGQLEPLAAACLAADVARQLRAWRLETAPLLPVVTAGLPDACTAVGGFSVARPHPYARGPLWVAYSAPPAAVALLLRATDVWPALVAPVLSGLTGPPGAGLDWTDSGGEGHALARALKIIQNR